MAYEIRSAALAYTKLGYLKNEEKLVRGIGKTIVFGQDPTPNNKEMVVSVCCQNALPL